MDALLNAFKGAAARMDARQGQVRVAVVASVDPDTHRARVLLQPGNVLSGWLPVAALQVGAGRGVVALPSPGDQVTVLPHEGDAQHGVVVPGLFSTKSAPPKSHATGKPIQPGEFGVVCDGAEMHLTGGRIHMKATEVVIAGDASVSGNLRVGGDVHADGDATAGGVSLRHHLTTGVKRGSDTSGPPQQ